MSRCIRRKQPISLDVHCATHNLNASINNTDKCQVELKSFRTNSDKYLHFIFISYIA